MPGDTRCSSAALVAGPAVFGISTFTALLPGRSVLCVSPVTTSTLRGGTAVRLVATTAGAVATAGLAAGWVEALVETCFFAGAAGAGLIVVETDLAGEDGAAVGAVAGSVIEDSASMASSGPNQNSRSLTTTRVSATSRRTRASISRRGCLRSKAERTQWSWIPSFGLCVSMTG